MKANKRKLVLRNGLILTFIFLFMEIFNVAHSEEPQSNSGEIGTWIVGELSFYDADGFYIDDYNIRIWGIDGVEKRQECFSSSNEKYKCGEEITETLKRKFDGQIAYCYVRDQNQYQKMTRYVSQCAIGSIEDFGVFAISSGFARSYVRFLRGTNYLEAYTQVEEVARDNEKGLWAGDWDAPWLWRARVQNGYEQRKSKFSFKNNIR